MTGGGQIRACRLLAAETPERDGLPDIVARLEATFGPKLRPRGGVFTARFGDPRSAWERTPGPAAERWCFASANPSDWWKSVLSGPSKEAGGGGPRFPPEQVRKASVLVHDDPALPTLLVVAELHIVPAEGSNLNRRELYMGKWSLQQWLRVLVHANQMAEFYAPVSVAQFECALPAGYDDLARRLVQLRETMDGPTGGADADPGHLRSLLEDLAAALPFGIGDAPNERCSHFIGYSNAHLSMGEWGYMTREGERSWLLQDFREPQEGLQLFQMHDWPASMLSLLLEMPGAELGVGADEFILPLVAERWALQWIGRARKQEFEVGAVIDQMKGAQPADVVRITQREAFALLKTNADLRYARQVVHRRTMPGVKRLVGSRRGFRPEIPGNAIKGRRLDEQGELYRLGRSLEGLLAECEEIQKRLDDDLAAATAAMATVTHVELAAKQAKAAAAMTWLTWVMMLLAVITMIATLVALFRS